VFNAEVRRAVRKTEKKEEKKKQILRRCWSHRLKDDGEKKQAPQCRGKGPIEKTWVRTSERADQAIGVPGGDLPVGAAEIVGGLFVEIGVGFVEDFADGGFG
jgi:hypothetical protein